MFRIKLSITFLRLILPIIGFEVKPIESDDDKKSSKVRINAIHKMIDSEDTTTIPLKLESTQVPLKCLHYIHYYQSVGDRGVLFVDELNARLHPLLVRTFVITFLNQETNPNHAQLIFTSHDSWQLNSNILRRDEVWFSEKAANGISTSIRLRILLMKMVRKSAKDENYEKNYLLGRYGAIPQCSTLMCLRGISMPNRNGKRKNREQLSSAVFRNWGTILL